MHTFPRAAVRTALTAMFVVMALPGRASDPLEVRLRPATGLGPLDVVVQLTLERNDGNRWVEVEVASDRFFTSSAWDIDGAAAPRRKDIRFRQLPPGEYDVRVTLTRDIGRRTEITRQLLIW